MDPKQQDLAQCALMNFKNFEQWIEGLAAHPIWCIAMAQLEEASGGRTMQQVADDYLAQQKLPALTVVKTPTDVF